MTNVTTPETWISYVNTATGDLYIHIVIFTLWVIVFLALGNKSREDAFAAASFISFLASAILWAATGVGAMAVILTTVATIASAMLLFNRK